MEIRGKRGQFWLRQRKIFTKRWGKRGLGDEFMRYFLAYFWRIKAHIKRIWAQVISVRANKRAQLERMKTQDGKIKGA